MEREPARAPDSPADDGPEPIGLSVCVVGATAPPLAALATSLARLGADLLLVDADDAALERLRETIEQEAEPAQVVVGVIDPSSAEQAAALAETIAGTLETLDVVVIGVERPAAMRILKCSPADVERALGGGLGRVAFATTTLMSALRESEVALLLVAPFSAPLPNGTVDSGLRAVFEAALERYLVELRKEASQTGVTFEVLDLSAADDRSGSTVATRVSELARAATSRPRPVPPPAQPRVHRPPEAPAVVDHEREKLREQLGNLYRRRTNAVQKKRELGSGWTPRYEAAYQEILSDIANLERRMGLPPSQSVSALRRPPPTS